MRTDQEQKALMDEAGRRVLEARADAATGDSEDRWGRMKRQNAALRDALEEVTKVADNWCVSGDCDEPIRRAQALLAQPPVI